MPRFVGICQLLQPFANSVQDAVIGCITYIQGYEVLGVELRISQRLFEELLWVSSWQAQTIT